MTTETVASLDNLLSDVEANLDRATKQKDALDSGLNSLHLKREVATRLLEEAERMINVAEDGKAHDLALKARANARRDLTQAQEAIAGKQAEAAPVTEEINRLSNERNNILIEKTIDDYMTAAASFFRNCVEYSSVLTVGLDEVEEKLKNCRAIAGPNRTVAAIPDEAMIYLRPMIAALRVPAQRLPGFKEKMRTRGFNV